MFAFLNKEEYECKRTYEKISYLKQGINCIFKD